jgi:hypothetical protein
MRKKYRIKERLGEAFRLYFILVTLITILLMVVGLIFDSGRTFSYEAFFSPLFYAFIGVIPVFFFQSDKELSMKRLVIRNIIYVLIIEAAMLFIVFKDLFLKKIILIQKMIKNLLKMQLIIHILLY